MNGSRLFPLFILTSLLAVAYQTGKEAGRKEIDDETGCSSAMPGRFASTSDIITIISQALSREGMIRIEMNTRNT
ncbi:MAG: hypothetical protein KA821_08300 [Chitinophagaceae bacterium]|nr:hypothetical protein [Chitinophagaceae bacterium]